MTLELVCKHDGIAKLAAVLDELDGRIRPKQQCCRKVKSSPQQVLAHRQSHFGFEDVSEGCNILMSLLSSGWPSRGWQGRNDEAGVMTAAESTALSCWLNPHY